MSTSVIITRWSLGPLYAPSLGIAFVFNATSLPIYFLVYVGAHRANSEPRRGSARATSNLTSCWGVSTQLFWPFFHPLKELGEVTPVGTDLFQILLVCIGAPANLTFCHGLQAPDHFHVFIIDDCPLWCLLSHEILSDRQVNRLLACQLCDETRLSFLHTVLLACKVSAALSGFH